MPIPTHAEINISDELIKKMTEVKRIVNDNSYITVIELMSTTLREKEKSTIKLYNQEDLIEVSTYKEHGIKETFKDDFFILVYEKVYQSFKIKMLYSNSACNEFTFKTDGFRID